MVPAVVAILFIAIGVTALTTGHPNEDAYILFTYVENFVAGHGIVYYPGGEPTQGFTDLVWFFVLSALNWLGVNVAVAACLVSACSAATVAWVLQKFAPGGWPWRVVIVLFCLTFHGSVASLGGFGALFFSALCALSYAAVRFRWPRTQLVLVALLPLVRLEGIACGAVLGFLYIWSNRSTRFAIEAVVCFGVPLFLVMMWRGWYFGDPVPLPAYVKSPTGELLPGLVTNLKWLYRETGPLPYLIAGLLAVRIARIGPVKLRAIGFAALPALAVMFPLLFAEQLQNVRWRFQSPATAVCVLCCVECLAAVWQAGRPRWLLCMLTVVAFAPTVALGTKHVVRLLEGDPQLHAHRFAPMMSEVLRSDATIATTEAGVIGYWSPPVHRIDIVGLNNRHFARTRDLSGLLEDVSADVLVFNTYDVVSDDGFVWDANGIVRLGVGPRLDVVRPREWTRLHAVAHSAAGVISENPAYEVFAVREGRNVLIWAFRRAGNLFPELERRFLASADKTRRRGYFDTLDAYR